MFWIELAADWKKYAVGTTGDVKDVLRDGAHARISILLMDADAIDAVRSPAGRACRDVRVGSKLVVLWSSTRFPVRPQTRHLRVNEYTP
jgi:hypothetical protein